MGVARGVSFPAPRRPRGTRLPLHCSTSEGVPSDSQARDYANGKWSRSRDTRARSPGSGRWKSKPYANPHAVS
jgi:hypothetical protein